MDRKIGLRVSLGVLGFAAFLYAAQELSREEQRQEVIRLCTSCHGCESYFSGRSEK
jgi:cytochrome c553